MKLSPTSNTNILRQHQKRTLKTVFVQYWTLLLCCVFFSGVSYAQCSAYMHQAAINEVSTNHNWKPSSADFVELRLIDSSIDSSIYNSWAVYVCTNVCLWTHVSNFSKTDSYLIMGGGAYSGTIDWNGGFEVWLIDAFGFTIDYVSVNGNSVLSPACTTPRDSTATSGSSTRRTRRLPDANGDWDTPPGNSEPATEGANNVALPANAALLDLSDATTSVGNNMVFNISVPNNVLSVVITYSTLDGTATAGTDYTSTTGTITIPAGTDSATITIPTLPGGSPSTFYLILDSVTNAEAHDQYAVGIITEVTETLDHFRYYYDGNALTCESETITIKACANAACDTLYENDVSLTLHASITNGNSIDSNLSFDTGTIELVLAESSVTTVTLSKTASVPVAPLVCYENQGVDPEGCNYETKDSGFIFLNDTNGTQEIPTQLSGKPSDVGYNAKTIVIQAVQTDPITGACAKVFADNTTVPVQLSHQCVNPDSCIESPNNENDFTLTNGGATYELTKYPNYGEHSLLFGADSKATIVMQYPDAGKVKLHAKKLVTLVEGEVAEMLGSSENFVVRPFGIGIATDTNNSNPAATDNTGGVFARAGQSFNMKVFGAQWVEGEDANNIYGVPDSGVNINDNLVTLNFGQEETPVNVTVTHALVSPVGGDASTLTGGAFSGFAGGIKTNAMKWNNVGIISLAAVLDTSTYLDTDIITGTVTHLGRFIPNHFRLNSSSVDNACVNFSYMGQPFDLSIDLEAQGVGNIPLNNYSADKGVGADNHALATYTIVAENSDDGNDLSDRLPAMSSPWSAGSVVQAYTPNFSRNSVATVIDGPFDNTLVGISLDDGEVNTIIDLLDVEGGGYNLNADEAGDCSVALNCDAIKLRAPGNLVVNEVSFRYGRLNAAPVFGPANKKLTLPLYTQTWNGSTFILSTDDSCSTIDAANISLAGVQNSPFDDDYNLLSLTEHTDVGDVQVDLSATNTSSTTLTAQSGAFNLTLGQTTEINGYVPVIIKDLDAWLRYNWDEGIDGVADEDLPVQNATFGQFRGNDRVIYWRERK